MKKNLKKVSVILMLALGSTFAMTSCGGAEDAAKALEDAAKEMKEGGDAEGDTEGTDTGDGEEMQCGEGKCGDGDTDSTMACGEGKCGDGMAADSAMTCEHGDDAEATCEGGDHAE